MLPMTLTRDHLITAYGNDYLLKAERELGECFGPLQRIARAYDFFGPNAKAALPLLNLEVPGTSFTELSNTNLIGGSVTAEVVKLEDSGRALDN